MKAILLILLAGVLFPHTVFASFAQESVSPTTGNNAGTYVFSASFSFSYHSYGFQIHIYRNGGEISGSPFTANVANAQIFNFGSPYEYTTGTLNYTTKLQAGTYTYRFAATYLPTNAVTLDSMLSGPTVTWGGGIGGYVCNYNGTAMPGITVTLSGSESRSTTTDGAGYYQFLTVNNGAMTVTPSGSFSPPNNSYNGLSSVQTNQNFKRTNTAPVLSWTGEDGYSLSGIEPANGLSTQLYTWRVKYTDADNDAPANRYPRIHVLKKGTEISASPFSMTYVSGGYNSGAVYTYSGTLAAGSDYSYYFDCNDIWLEGSNTPTCPGPLVTTPAIIDSRSRVSGTVRDPAGNAVEGIVLTLTGAGTGTCVTNALGYYEFLISSMSYIVTPSGKNYSHFEPSSLTYENTTQDQNSQSFIAYPYPLPSPTIDSGKTKDGASFVSSKIQLSWECSTTPGQAVTYTLYLSAPQDAASTIKSYRAPETMQAIYTGSNTSYDLSNLIPGKAYYWQVKIEDIHGLSSTSPVYSFKTFNMANDKAFNYPNPFNPTREKTHIVFKTNEIQTANITVYAENGVPVFHGTADAGPGTNEYVYNGSDDNGNILYNGSYICRIEKMEGTDKCYLLIIK